MLFKVFKVLFCECMGWDFAFVALETERWIAHFLPHSRNAVAPNAQQHANLPVTNLPVTKSQLYQGNNIAVSVTTNAA